MRVHRMEVEGYWGRGKTAKGEVEGGGGARRQYQVSIALVKRGVAWKLKSAALKGVQSRRTMKTWCWGGGTGGGGVWRQVAGGLLCSIPFRCSLSFRAYLSGGDTCIRNTVHLRT